MKLLLHLPLPLPSSVILHLKEDAQELADPVRLARLIKMYSQFIQFPIKLYSSKKEPQEVTDEVATQKKQEEEDKRAKEAEEEPKKVGGGGRGVRVVCDRRRTRVSSVRRGQYAQVC